MDNMNDNRRTNSDFSIRDYIAFALPRCGKIAFEGAQKYGRDNWKNLNREDNIDQAMKFLLASITDIDSEEDFLGLAVDRLLMVIAKEELIKALRKAELKQVGRIEDDPIIPSVQKSIDNGPELFHQPTPPQHRPVPPQQEVRTQPAGRSLSDIANSVRGK